MTARTRLQAVGCAFGLALCLVATRPPQVVGDGGEYLVYAINFASLNGPSLRTRDLDRLKQEVRDYAPEIENETFYRNAVAGRDGRRDFMHFWFFSLVAAPYVWLARVVGAPAVYGFVAFNLTLFLAALWLALPRIGLASSLLLFASPVVWWLDKPHTEVFTFSLLTIVVLFARDKPWWSIIAAGVASTQYPHIGAVIPLIAAVACAFDRACLRDRRFVYGIAAAFAIAVLHPAYYYLRHGTPSLLLTVSNTGAPTWAELSALVIDPVIGLLPNFPVFAMVLVAALALIVARGWKALLSADTVVVVVTSAFFLWVFAQKDNVHHGATPSLSRYTLWFIPMAIPFLRLERVDGRFWRRLAWTCAVTSAVVCAFAFHPAVHQNSREPTWVARYVWEKHPGWNNPLPEVFTETYHKSDDALAPTTTYGCEKILLGGRGEAGTWPVPCFPKAMPMPCGSRNVWCYANRSGAGYEFVRAPGRWNQVPTVQETEVWPREAEDTVRRFYRDWEWWNLKQDLRKIPELAASSWVRVQIVGGDDRFILVLRDARPQATLTLKLPVPMHGLIVDGRTGATLQTLQFAGDTTVDLPDQPDLMLMGLRR